MKKRLISLSLGLAALIAYLLFYPVPVDPVAWDAPKDEGYVGVFSPNTDLAELDLIPLGGVHGPEDIVSIRGDAGVVLYVSSQEGSILKINPETSPPQIQTFAQTKGVPLGMEMDSHGNLIVADAFRGLLSVSPDREVTTLTNSVDGTPILYADDLDIAPDGVIYFSDASTKFGAEATGETLAASLLEILEQGSTGRLLAYDPQTQETRHVVGELSFANGVAIAPNGQSVLVIETGRYRLLRVWITQDRYGEVETLIDNLPGFPDNINRGPDDTFFLGLVSRRAPLADKASNTPWLRKVALRLPRWMQPQAKDYGFIIQINANGEVLKTWQDPDGAYPLTTGAIVADDGFMYISSLKAENLGRRPFP